MSLSLTFERAGEAFEGRAIGFGKHGLVMRLPVAFAPGAPIQTRVALPGGVGTVEGRCIGSKRQDDGTFEVRMRMTNLRREHRLALEVAFGD